MIGVNFSVAIAKLPIDDLTPLGYIGIGVTNAYAGEAITRIGLYPSLLSAHMTLQAAHEALSKYSLGQSERINLLETANAATLTQLSTERKAWQSQSIKDKAIFSGIGAGAGVVLGILATSLVVSALRR